MSEREPSEEELRATLEEQMRRLRVEDVVLQTAATLVNLAARRLGLGPPDEPPVEKELEQARLAIEAVRALQPVIPSDQAAAVKDALSQIQMAYAQEARAAGAPAGAGPGAGAASETPAGAGAGTGGSGPGGAPEGPPPPGEGPSQAPDPEHAREEAERARARSKIWTPPGT